MKKSLIGTVLVLVLVVIAVATFVKKELNEDVQLTEGIQYEIDLTKGEPAPNFTLTTLDGEEVSLADFRGQKVVLNFWATWLSLIHI